MGRGRLRAIAPLVLLFLAPVLAIESDFNFYPIKAQSCLYRAAKPAKCGGANVEVEQLNECLCGNTGNFILNTAQCLGEEDPGDVQNVYRIMSSACADSDTPMDVSQSQFYAAAKGELVSTTSSLTTASATESATVSVTPTSTPSDTAPSGDEDGGLSTPAVIGIAVGGSLVGIAFVGGLAAYLIRRRRKGGEESHPMLPRFSHDPRFSTATTFPPTEPSPAFNSQFDRESKLPAWAAGLVSSHQSPEPTYQTPTSGWDDLAASHGGYKGAYASPDTSNNNMGGARPQPTAHTSGHIFEMDGTGLAGPLEMQGSSPRDSRERRGSS